MNNIFSEIQIKLPQSENELYIELSKSMGDGAILRNPVSQGKKIFNALIKKLRLSICANEQARMLYCEQADATFLIASILDSITLIISKLSLPIAPITIAVLIYRVGLKNICEEQWGNDDFKKK